MNYLKAAKALDELMLELIEKEVGIPQHVTDDLKTGRSLANICSRKPEDPDISSKTMIALERVEMNLLALAEHNLGRDEAEAWQRRMIAIYREPAVKAAPPPASGVMSGIPRGDHWIRVQSSYLESVAGARELLEGAGLSVVIQEDDYLLIHGRKGDVSAFLKDMRELIGKLGSECNN